MQVHPKIPKRNDGAFLIIALILLIVLSAVGVAALSMATTSQRVSNNYAKYIAAEVKALSMAGYAQRILDTFEDGVYFGPGTCNSAVTCNVIDNTFPMNGRPLLPWVSGAGTLDVYGASQTDSWWNTNAFNYEATFAGSGNSRVVVTLLGADPNSPYANTYRITGYGTDPITGVVKATFESFHVWKAYPVDPGDGTCANACNYAQCCSDTTTCGADQASCEDASATYVPPGWTCNDYFVDGLGYGGSTCANPIAPPN